jgi:hypothetical protein
VPVAEVTPAALSPSECIGASFAAKPLIFGKELPIGDRRPEQVTVF